jgi:hypothetical protein
MAKTAYKTLEEIFTNQITVLNIAVPTSVLEPEAAKESCLTNNYNTHLVQQTGNEDLQVYINKSNIIRPLSDSEVISESTPISEVLESLCIKEQLFVKVKRDIAYIVSRSDLDTIPVRIWLYGMISIFEIELKAKVNQLNFNWEKKLSNERMQKARELYNLKKSKNEEIDLLGCIQLADLGTIIFKTWEQFDVFFPYNHSRSRIRSYLIKINLIRDALAHGQKLMMEWPEIHNLIKLISYSLGKT